MIAGTFNANNGCITAFVNGQIFTVDKSHHNYILLLESYKSGNIDDFTKFYFASSKEEVVKEFLPEIINGSGLEFKDNKLFYNSKEVHHSYVNRIVEAASNGFPIEPMLRFFENLLQNPSAKSVAEAPEFLMNKHLPLTDDGCFLAYKSVKSDFYSKSSGTLTLLSGKCDHNGFIYNGVGEVIECPRNEVDDERGNECSHGLHVGGLEYSGPGGSYNSSSDNVIVVKVNPKDIVSVPRDYNAQKMRVCKYEVVSLFQKPLDNCCHEVEKTSTVLYRNVDIDNLVPLDTISFDYLGKNDSVPKSRFIIIEEVVDNGIYGTLLPADPSYEEGDEIRHFLFSRISNINYYSL